MVSLNKFFHRLGLRPESTYEIGRAVGIAQRTAYNYKTGKVKRPSHQIVLALEHWMDSHPVDSARKNRASEK